MILNQVRDSIKTILAPNNLYIFSANVKGVYCFTRKLRAYCSYNRTNRLLTTIREKPCLCCCCYYAQETLLIIPKTLGGCRPR